jgi:hypothetical protein
MKKIVLDDFSGGISQSGAFSALSQLAKADGFVRNDAKRVRSQWPIDAVVDPSPPASGEKPLLVVPFDRDFIFFYPSGKVHTTNPDYVSVEIGLPISNIEVISNGTAGVMDDLFIRYRTNTGIVQLGRIYKDPPWKTRYINGVPLRGEYLNPIPSEFGFATKPTNVGDINTIPDSGRRPPAKVHGKWKDYEIYANTIWNDLDNTLSVPGPDVVGYQGGVASFPNMMWFMSPTDPTQPYPFPVRGAQEGEEITGFQEVEEGLLVFTKPELLKYQSGNAPVSFYEGYRGTQSNIYLLRGGPDDQVSETGSGSFEIIARNISVSSPSHFWETQQSVVFVSDAGRLYQYKNMRIADITPPFLVESEFLEVANEEDPIDIDVVPLGAVATYGPNLLFWHSATATIFAMHVMDNAGVWSKVVGLPSQKRPLFIETHTGIFVGTRQSIEATTDSGNYENAFEVVGPFVINMQPRAGTTHRGDVSGEPLDLVFATAPVGFDTPHAEKWWHQIGIRAKCAPGNPDGAKVKAVTTRGVLADGTEVEHREVLTEQVASLSASGLLEYLVPAYGYGPTCQVELECQGDIIIESITIWWQSGTERW